MKTKLTITLCSILLLFACKKQDAGLTKASQVGAQTFSCKVNGRKFLPKQDLFGPKPLVVDVNRSNGNEKLYISAHQYDHFLRSMAFYIDGFKGVGVYSFEQPVVVKKSDGTIVYHMPGIYAQLNLAYPATGSFYALDGHLNITRYDSGIISGTFEYTFLNGSETVSVTYGRFDLKL